MATYNTVDRSKLFRTGNVSATDFNISGGTSGQALITDGSGNLSFSDVGALNVYATIDDLPLSGQTNGTLSFVTATKRLYIWSATGWYNIALINTNPSITGGYSSNYRFETDGTPIEITLVGSDPEGITLTWSYEVTSGSLTNGGGTTATVSQADNVFTITPSTVEDYAGTFTITFKASDGVNIGTAVSEFTLAFFVADSKYTSLLIKGLTSGNNATFIDGSTNNFTITKNGDVTQGTFSPYGDNWSTLMDGTSNYVTVPYDASRAIGTNDFCIESYVCITAQSSDYDRAMSHQGSYASGIGVEFGLGTVAEKVLALSVSGNSTTYAAGVYTFKYGEWVHAVITRESTTLRVFFNGVLVYVNQSFTTNISGTNYTTFARNNYNTSDNLAGVMLSNFRLTNGSVPTDYSTTSTTTSTQIFTPPIEKITTTSQGATEADVKLILFADKRIHDESVYGVSHSTVGAPTVLSGAPFDRRVYDPTVHGGSGYFDGSTTSLSVPYNSNLTFPAGTDFTIDAWVYRTAAADGAVVASYPGAASGNWIIRISSTGYLQLYIYTPMNWFGGATPQVIPLNTWAHIAVTRSGTTFELFVNGVSCGTTATTINFGNANPITIGQYNSTMYFPGYISNLRFTSGSAIDFSSTGVPTAPVSGTGTELTLNFTNADILDYSSKNNLKLVGDTSTSSAQTKYSTRSVYFDGTGDYLRCALSDRTSLWRSDKFTIEFWGYTSAITEKVFISQVTSTSAFSMGIAGNGKPYAAVGITYGSVGEGGTLSLSAPSPLQFVALTYGYYGTVNTSIAPQYYDDTRVTGYDIISAAYLYKTSGSQVMNNSIFGDPASGVSKTGAAVAHHGILGTNVIIANTWNHYAFVKNGSTITLYVNGTQESTATYASDIGNTSTDIYLGTSYCQNNAKLQLDGYIEDLRVTKGLARYTANFTPPTSELLG